MVQANPVDAKTAQQIARSTFGSTVLLVMEDANGQPISLGSGFIVKEGVIATNLHIVEGASAGYAKLIGKKSKFNIEGIVGLDPLHDLILLKISASQTTGLSLGNSDIVEVGEQVYVVGNPQGLEGTFSQGIVSSIRDIGKEKLLQITAPISPGSSGGPVLNSSGQVIGVAVATFKGGQNLNFAIPSNYLSSLISKQTNIKPLSNYKPRKSDKNIVANFGGRSTEGVTGRKLTWTYIHLQLGDYSFTLKNNLREPVKNVYCLVIFYDASGEPIDVDEVRYKGTIRPKLAKRINGRVDNSVQKITTRIDFRILYFEIVE